MQADLFISLTVLLFAAYLLIGYLTSHKNVSSVDYLLAGKSLGIPAVTATLLAAQVGGGMFLGTAQNPFHGLLYIVGVALGLLILGLGLAEKMRTFNVSSVGEIFEKTYQSVALHHLSGFLSTISLLGILIGQILAAKSLLSTFAGIHSELFLLFFWLGIIAYTMIGGLHTVVITDFFRIVFIILIFSSICIYSVITNPLSFFSSENMTGIATVFNQTGLTWTEALRIVLMPAFFCLVEHDIAQKFFSARTQKIASISALLASILLIIFSFVPFYFGIQGKLLFTTQLAQGVSPLLPVLTALTSPFFFTIALCGLLAAITSTSDSLLCALSGLLTKPCSNILSIEPSVFLSRAIILCAGVTTLAASYFFSEEIIDVLVDSYEISICAIFVPFITSLFLKDFRAQAAWAATITGIIFFLFFKIPAIPHFSNHWTDFTSAITTYHPYATFITLCGSFMAYGIGFVFTTQNGRPLKQ
jgi:SSS family solute:Na+ symporter